MNQDFNKIFKTPKYTGVTLSLLSMFVLAAMFVVWQKFPKQDPQESEQNISILCDFKLKIPVEKILASFKKEYPCSFLINFMDAEELTSALENKSGSYADLLIANKTILQKFAYSDYGEGIPFAFEKLSNSPPEQQSDEPFVCSIKNDTPHSHFAFALGRYFSAQVAVNFSWQKLVLPESMVIHGNSGLEFPFWCQKHMKIELKILPKNSASLRVLIWMLWVKMS